MTPRLILPAGPATCLHPRQLLAGRGAARGSRARALRQTSQKVAQGLVFAAAGSASGQGDGLCTHVGGEAGFAPWYLRSPGPPREGSGGRWREAWPRSLACGTVPPQPPACGAAGLKPRVGGTEPPGLWADEGADSPSPPLCLGMGVGVGVVRLKHQRRVNVEGALSQLTGPQVQQGGLQPRGQLPPPPRPPSPAGRTLESGHTLPIG